LDDKKIDDVMDMEGHGHGLFEVISGISLEGLRSTMRNLSG
jgi:hypothetical protein